MSEEDIRWKQRFQNFERVFLLLQEALALELPSLSQLEKEGIIQRFEYTFELAWKVLTDRMQEDGLVLDRISPKSVIRKAFATGYIQNAEVWFQMTDDRNLMSHTYDLTTFERGIEKMKKQYLPAFRDLYAESKSLNSE